MRRLMIPVFFMVLATVFVAASFGGTPRPEVIQIPTPGFQPEGIATGRGASFYVGSIPTGAVVRGNLRTGACCTPVVPGTNGRPAIGVAFDRRHDRLFVAGGPTGQGYVYDAATGADIAVFQLASVTRHVRERRRRHEKGRVLHRLAPAGALPGPNRAGRGARSSANAAALGGRSPTRRLRIRSTRTGSRRAAAARRSSSCRATRASCSRWIPRRA